MSYAHEVARFYQAGISFPKTLQYDIL